MLRKEIHKDSPAHASKTGLDVAALARVKMSSEDPAHPIDCLFDDKQGPGGTYWQAEDSGDQVIILEFDTPQTIRRVIFEVEEAEVSRRQQVQLSISEDGGRSYREIVRQEYNFNPSGATFEHEEWTLEAEQVTHLKIWIRPDMEEKACRAKATALILY